MVLDICKYSQSFLSLFCPFIFAGLLSFYVQKKKKTLLVLIVGKALHKKSRETHGPFSPSTFISITNQEKL